MRTIFFFITLGYLVLCSRFAFAGNPHTYCELDDLLMLDIKDSALIKLRHQFKFDVEKTIEVDTLEYGKQLELQKLFEEAGEQVTDLTGGMAANYGKFIKVYDSYGSAGLVDLNMFTKESLAKVQNTSGICIMENR